LDAGSSKLHEELMEYATATKKTTQGLHLSDSLL
jgi:hypothetical protein